MKKLSPGASGRGCHIMISVLMQAVTSFGITIKSWSIFLDTIELCSSAMHPSFKAQKQLLDFCEMFCYSFTLQSVSICPFPPQELCRVFLYSDGISTLTWIHHASSVVYNRNLMQTEHRKGLQSHLWEASGCEAGRFMCHQGFVFYWDVAHKVADVHVWFYETGIRIFSR
jgi:hypothetical protein